jgi:hypothetical protein
MSRVQPAVLGTGSVKESRLRQGQHTDWDSIAGCWMLDAGQLARGLAGGNTTSCFMMGLRRANMNMRVSSESVVRSKYRGSCSIQPCVTEYIRLRPAVVTP